MIRKTLLWFCLCAGVVLSAQTVPEQGTRKEILVNDRVHVASAVLPAHGSTPLHRHDRDFLVIPLDDAKLTNHEEGKPAAEVVLHRGEPVLIKGGFSHLETNEGDAAVHLTVVEFLAPQGVVKKITFEPSKFCNQGSATACVSEKYLFCSEKMCVSSVEFGPGVATEMHTHSTPHMVIALTDMEIKDQEEGRPAVTRNLKSGEVFYQPAGITHALVNGSKTAKFITVLWQ